MIESTETLVIAQHLDLLGGECELPLQLRLVQTLYSQQHGKGWKGYRVVW